MSRKRKSAPPRRLDAAAREEHNWEASKEEVEAVPVLAPAALAKDDLPHPERSSIAEGASNQEPNEEDNHRVQEKQFRETLDKLQELYEQDLPRAAKKPRKTLLATFTIPFNKSKDERSGGEDFVELRNITVICDGHNEEFYSSINADTHHLYTRFVATGTPLCDFVKEGGEVMASATLPLPQPVTDSLFFLQKRGVAYLDAFPVMDAPDFKMHIRIFFTPEAFVTCSPINSNTKGVNNHIRDVINFVYNITPSDLTTTTEINNNNNSDTNDSNNDSNTNIDNIITTTTTSTEVIHVEGDDEKGGGAETTNHYQFDPLQVYSPVKPTNTEPQLDPAPLADALIPTLRPYQLRAAYWMLQRERKIHEESNSENPPTTLLHPLWTEFNSENGKTFYYNSITGMLTFQKFTVEEGEFSDIIPGGILADEPGLGKTLEVLALVLSNPHPAMPEEEESKGKGKEKAEVVEQASKSKETAQKKGKGKAAPKRGPGTANNGGTSKKKRRKESSDDEDDEEFKPSSSSPSKTAQAAQQRNVKLEEDEKTEENEGVVNCPCGRQEVQHQKGLWVCCDQCSTWMFAACIGYRPSRKKLNTPFLCPKCDVVEVDVTPMEEDMIDARGTLIWRQEIERHTIPGALSVRVYRGVRSGDLISSAELAKFDIVLTTYDVLRTELDHVDTTGREGTLRSKKRYHITPTPLTSLIWWRICLDEAQMVESTTTKAAMMALQLTTRHRWCVTGTPIQRGLEDLFGLFLFLQATPFDDKFWWHNAIQTPYEKDVASAKDRLHNFLKPIMWRNTKADVAHELQLPAQVEKEVKLLRFSAVESTFYRKQHEDCSSKARAALRTFASRGSPITSRLRSAKVLRPLLRLRQACCHPQVGSRGVRALQKNSLTMDELLDHLNMTAKVDCQEAQRAVLATTNGLAALDIIDNDTNGAAEKYRSALRLIESNEGVIEADKFQQLHIYHNLAEMVEIGNLSANTLRDGTFKNKAEALRNKIVAYRENMVAEELRKARETTAKVILDSSFCKKTPNSRLVPWWLDATIFIEKNRLFGDFMTRISQLERNNRSARVWEELRDPSGLSMTLTLAYDELFKLRNTLLEKVNELDAPLSRADVSFATCCQVCAKTEKKTKGVVCMQCQCLALVEQYQKNLFSVIVKNTRAKDDSDDEEEDSKKEKKADGDEGEQEEEEQSELWWAQKGTVAFGSSEYEHILQVLVSMLRLYDRNDPILQSAQMHFDALSTMREECKKIVAFIVAKQDLVNVLDEVDMAVSRIRLRYPGEPVLPVEALFKLHPAEVDPTRTRLTAELVVHETELKKMKGQLHYLKSLGEARKRQALRRQFKESSRATSEAVGVTNLSIADPTDPNFASSSSASTGDTSAGDTSAGDTSAGDTSASEASASNASASNARADDVIMGCASGASSSGASSSGDSSYASAAASSIQIGTGSAAKLETIESGLSSLHVVTPTPSTTNPITSNAETSRTTPLLPSSPTNLDALSYSTENTHITPPPTSSPVIPILSTASNPPTFSDATAANTSTISTDTYTSNTSMNTPTITNGTEITTVSDNSTNETTTNNNNTVVNTSFNSATSDDVIMSPDDDESTCPICREPFSSDVVILMCGHTFCYECMMFMIERIKLGNTFKCPSCRTRVNIDEISYVSEGSGNQGEYAHINVKGSWGTKIEAVVRELIMLREVEPGTKALLFSQWNEVLEIVSRALAENGVKFARVQGKRSVEKAINSFKKEANITALLLPVASGANGLNLVEATHVFLIDPLLNPAAEAQAINRVHRIGQTRVTVIHRFIVGGTIEEKVWSLGKHKASHHHSDFWRMQSKKEHDLLTIKDFCDLFADANGNV